MQGRSDIEEGSLIRSSCVVVVVVVVVEVGGEELQIVSPVEEVLHSLLETSLLAVGWANPNNRRSEENDNLIADRYHLCSKV